MRVLYAQSGLLAELYSASELSDTRARVFFFIFNSDIFGKLFRVDFFCECRLVYPVTEYVFPLGEIVRS